MQFADGLLHQEGQITLDVSSVFSREFDFTAKREIITCEHAGTGDDTSGECLVVTVSDA
jgi:hypothetical protein